MEWLEEKKMLTDFLKKYKYVLGIAMLGVILMLIPEKNEINKPELNQQELSNETLQSSLEKILTKIDGAGRVNVLLTEYSGEEMIYQLDETTSNSPDVLNTRTETVIFTDSDRDENGMIRKIISPVYKGALIVCQGADSAVVRLAIVEAVSKLTGLSTNQISVLKMK